MAGFTFSVIAIVAIFSQSTSATSTDHKDGQGAEAYSDETSFIQASAVSKQMEVKSQELQKAKEQDMKNNKATCPSNMDGQSLGADISCKSLGEDEMIMITPKGGQPLSESDLEVPASQPLETVDEARAAVEKDLNANDEADSTLMSSLSSLYYELLTCIAGSVAVLAWRWYAKQGKYSASTAKRNVDIGVAGVRSNLNPYATDDWGCTALHDAAKAGSAATAKQLVERGFKVDAADAWDETPLHLAAREGHIEVCSELLAKRATIDAINAQDWTPLVVAADAGQEAMCSWLLARGAGKAGLPDEELPPLLRQLMSHKQEVNADGTDR